MSTSTSTDCPLLLVKGHLVDTCFDRPDVALILDINAISLKTFGVVDKIFEKYPYGETVKNRVQLYDLSRADVKARPDVGTFIVKTNPKKPTIISLVTQYSYGLPYECNSITNNIVKTTKDYHYGQGLRNDTEIARLCNFKMCIKGLISFAKLPENSNLSVFVFNCGIGRSSKMDDVWVNEYLPVLKTFARELITYGITTLIVSHLPTNQIPSNVISLGRFMDNMGLFDSSDDNDEYIGELPME